MRADRAAKMAQGNYELYKRTISELEKAEAERDAILKALRNSEKDYAALREKYAALVEAAAIAEEKLRSGGTFPITGETWGQLKRALAKLDIEREPPS